MRELQRVRPDMVKRIDIVRHEDRDNPHWAPNTVTWYERGKQIKATTDPLVADVLRLDPHHVTSGMAGIPEHMRSWFEFFTTGKGAPWFAPTSAVRSYRQGKITMAADMPEGPTILGSLAAIPQQLVPQFAEAVAGSMRRGSFGWLDNVLGPQSMYALASNLTRHLPQLGPHPRDLIAAGLQRFADNSLYKDIQRHGGVNASILATDVEKATTNLRSYIKNNKLVTGNGPYNLDPNVLGRM